MSGTLTTGKLVLTDTTSNTDTFGRLRVSLPQTLFEIKHVHGKEQFLMDELVSGTGASTHNSSESYVAMTVSSSGVGKVVRQSYEYIPYQPGKTKIIFFTGVIEVNNGVSGSVSRIGSFDSSTDKTSVSGKGNGHFFELNGTNMYVVERFNNTDTKVIQSSWNVDTLDGNGPSGLTVTNWDKTKIYFIDMEWLGVGVVRFGVHINGENYIVHQLNHSGLGTPSSTGITRPYIKSAKLPIRYEIESSSGVSAEMRMICSTVISDGGFEPVGKLYSISRITAVSITSSTTFAPVISLRLKETDPVNRISIVLKKLSLFNSAGSTNFAGFRLYLLPDDSALTGESWVNVSSNSAAQYDISASAVTLTNAYLIDSGFIQIRDSQEYSFDSYINSPVINSNIAGKSRILSLCAVKLNNNCDIYGGFQWLEVE